MVSLPRRLGRRRFRDGGVHSLPPPGLHPPHAHRAHHRPGGGYRRTVPAHVRRSRRLRASPALRPAADQLRVGHDLGRGISCRVRGGGPRGARARPLEEGGARVARYPGHGHGPRRSRLHRLPARRVPGLPAVEHRAFAHLIPRVSGFHRHGGCAA